VLHTQGEAEAMLDALNVLGCMPKKYEFEYDTRTSRPAGLCTVYTRSRWACWSYLHQCRGAARRPLQRTAAQCVYRCSLRSIQEYDCLFRSLPTGWENGHARQHRQPRQRGECFAIRRPFSDAPAKAAVRASRNTEDMLEFG
jgi:hypothetical protein